jgi:hypothetical protein
MKQSGASVYGACGRLWCGKVGGSPKYKYATTCTLEKVNLLQQRAHSVQKKKKNPFFFRATTLTFSCYRVSGELPSLHMKLSAEKYDKIMNLVDKITGGPKIAPAVPVEATEVYVPASVVIIIFFYVFVIVMFISPSPLP